MDIFIGKSYHIKDDFFALVNDEKLMTNKEGSNYGRIFSFLQTRKFRESIGLSCRAQRWKNTVLLYSRRSRNTENAIPLFLDRSAAKKTHF